MVDKREELGAAFLAHLQKKQYDEAGPMLAETVMLTVPQVPAPIQGRDAIMMAMRMASESGQGLDMAGFSTPKTEADGTVRVSGRAPKGALWLVAFVLRKAKKVAVSLRFGEGDLIEGMEIVLT
jgi:hypothetical protein